MYTAILINELSKMFMKGVFCLHQHKRIHLATFIEGLSCVKCECQFKMLMFEQF